MKFVSDQARYIPKLSFFGGDCYAEIVIIPTTLVIFLKITFLETKKCNISYILQNYSRTK